MKRIITTVAAFLLVASMWAQSPEKMSYQAVIRDAGNSLVTNQSVGMQISILQGGSNGVAVYVETQTINSNTNGLVSLEIGSGIVVNGNFAAIDWANDTYFIKTETDPTGGTSYTITGTTQLMSVPYALYAKTSGSSTPGPQGVQGVAGATGPQGSVGNTGAAGTNGNNGAVGAQGPIGLTGPQGPIGLTGAQGPTGLTGSAGTNGIDGSGVTIQGSDTYANILAITANSGDMWIVSMDALPNATTGDGMVWDGTTWNNVGPIRGPQGLQGSTGATGSQGATGNTGAAGTNGTNGTNGNDGAQGPIGITGAVGAIGSQGPIGLTGATGSQGSIGLTGVAGPQGVAGATGSQGATGNTGAVGTNGNDGAVGAQGPTGANGNDGAAGLQGPAGPDDQTIDAFSLSGTTLSLSLENDGQVTQTVDLSSLSGGGGGAFTTTTGVTSNASGAYGTDDFVFGSPQLNDDGITTHDSRLYFDKSKSAFRAGYVTGTEWNTTNSGQYSVAFGRNTIASGRSSVALGEEVVATGNMAIAGGRFSTASGHYSTAIGYNTTASGEGATALGKATTAKGINSTATGYNTTAKSYRSTVIGSYNIISGDSASWISTDPLFVIGNGTGSRSNALTVLKNGNMGIGVVDPDAALEVAGQIKVTGGTPGAGKVLTSDVNGLATWATPAAGGGGTDDQVIKE